MTDAERVTRLREALEAAVTQLETTRIISNANWSNDRFEAVTATIVHACAALAATAPDQPKEDS